MKFTTLIAVAGIVLATPSFAGPTEVIVGSGSKGGTYFPVVNEISLFCNSSTLTVSPYMDAEGNTGGGSVANLRRILNNEAMGGIVQTDVAFLEKSANPAMARVVALLPLHTEQVHLIVQTEVSVMVKEATEGFLGIGGSEAEYEVQGNPIRMLSDLKGQTVAAWGGSITTAKVISSQDGLQLDIVDAESQEKAMGMLKSGEVSAVLAVAGAPVQWIEELPAKKYSLLSVSDRDTEALSAVYGVSGISYDNLGETGQRMNALAVDALLMTRTYRTDDMIGALAELQSCVRNKIYEIQDTPGTHPAWQGIDPNRDMLWDNQFVAPEVSAVTPAAAVQ